MLILIQECQEHDPAVRKFQRIVMGSDPFFVDLPKDRYLMLDYFIAAGYQARRKHLTSSAKDSSVPGRTQTAMFMSSDAANPTVPVVCTENVIRID